MNPLALRSVSPTKVAAGTRWPLGILRQWRLLEIGGNADNGVDERGSNGDAKCRADSCLQVEMLWIDADRSEPGEHTAGPAANGGGK